MFKWTGQLNPAFLPPTPKGKLTETGSPTSKLILGDLGPVFFPPLTCLCSTGGGSGTVNFLNSWRCWKRTWFMSKFGHGKFQGLAFLLFPSMPKWPWLWLPKVLQDCSGINPDKGISNHQRGARNSCPHHASLGSQLSCPEPCCINTSLILNESSDPWTLIWDFQA